MTQEATQITTTPPLPGLQLVQDLNKALQTLATDFAGPDDPAALASAHTRWLDTSTNPPTLKRRNAANSAWLVELGTVAARDVGVGPDQVPTNSDLGAAAFADIKDGEGDSDVDVMSQKAVTRAVQSTLDSLQPHIEASATFTRSSNQIQLTGIVTALALEAGDVIEITGSADNNRLHTVESISDDDTIIVNYEHRNGSGSLSLVDETATVTIKRIAKWFNAPIGLGQAWVDVTESRLPGVTYTNTHSRPIMAAMGAGTASTTAFYIDGVVVSVSTVTASGGANLPYGGFIVPDGSTYQYTSSATASTFAELR